MSSRAQDEAVSDFYGRLVSAARVQKDRRVPIPDVAYPEGAKIAVNFTLDFDAMLLRRLLDEPWGQKAKGEYTSSDEIGIRDSGIAWPDGLNMAMGLTVNLNPATSGKGISEKDLASPTWHFGVHEGLDAFLDVLERLSLKATFAVPALVAEAYPDRMEEILGAEHEIAAQASRRGSESAGAGARGGAHRPRHGSAVAP